jgi:hypothetical protein
VQASTNARLRALACSSQPAAASPVEASPTASAPTALHDAQACKRMRQNATQLRGGNKKGEGKIPLKTQSSSFRPPQDPSSLRVVARSISTDRFLRRRTSLQIHASETKTTKRREQKGQASTNARLRALACSSQPAAASPVETSPTASAPTALHDAQACKRMRQKATQPRGGNKKGEGKKPLETRSSGCLLHSALHATVCLPYEAQFFSCRMLHAHALMTRRAQPPPV